MDEIIFKKRSSTKTTKAFLLDLSNIARLTKDMKTTVYDRFLGLI
jgi:hypothetical protein